MKNSDVLSIHSLSSAFIASSDGLMFHINCSSDMNITCDQSDHGCSWTTRVIASIALATSTIYLAGMKTRLPPRTKRRLININALKELPFLLFGFGTFFGFMGIYVVYFYIQLYATKVIPNVFNKIPMSLVCIVNVGSPGRVFLTFIAD